MPNPLYSGACSPNRRRGALASAHFAVDAVFCRRPELPTGGQFFGKAPFFQGVSWALIFLPDSIWAELKSKWESARLMARNPGQPVFLAMR